MSTSCSAVGQLRTAGAAAYMGAWPGATPRGCHPTENSWDCRRVAGSDSCSCETPRLCETDSPSQSPSLHIGVVVKRRQPIIILMATIIPAACHLLSEGVK